MKTVIVTGGSGDIGKQISYDFAKENFFVIVHYYKDKKSAEKIVEGIISSGGNASAFCADLSNLSESEKLCSYAINLLGHIDVLVNNAGVSLHKLFQDVTEYEWKRLFDVNVGSVFNCTKSVIKHMINRKYGKIINISSIWGIVGASMEVHYSASKAAIIGFTKALAKEVGPSNICVNCVAPGVIDTKMNNFDDETRENIKDVTPLCRIGNVSDISKTVLFLSSDDANFITGQVISPNGGFVI